MLTAATVLTLAHLAYIQSLARGYYMQYATVPVDRVHQVQGLRGQIVDRVSRTLVLSVGTVDISASPPLFRSWATHAMRKAGLKIEKPYRQYEPIRRAAQEVADDLQLDRMAVLERLCRDTQYVVLAKRLEPGLAARLRARGIGGLHYQTLEQRRYPRHFLASSLLGYCDADQIPRTGVEYSFRHITEGQRLAVGELQVKGGMRVAAGQLGQQVRPERGNDLVLTLDLAAQQVAENVLDKCISISRPDAASVVVMNAHNSAIIAMACRPSYDAELVDEPRDVRGPVSLFQRLNRPVTLAEEPGSIFKFLTITAALDCGAITEGTTFHCAGTEPIGGRPLKCWDEYAVRGHGVVTPSKILEMSCNIGAAKVALLMGAPRFCKFLTLCGIGQFPNAGFPAETRGKLIAPQKMKRRDLANCGFGHSVQVSDLQMTAAICAVMNGGVYHQPHIVQGYRDPATGQLVEMKRDPGRRVCSKATSDIIRKMSQRVVDFGTGKKAAIANVAVGGKTATAQLYHNGQPMHGSRDFTMSFVLIAPVDREPDFVVLVTAKRPQHGLHGADVAAPRTSEIARYLLKQPNLFRDDAKPAPQASPSKGQKAA